MAKKTSVKLYQQNTELEKQKMKTYARKMKTDVKSLQADFKKHAKDMNAAAAKMLEDGRKNMSQKVGKFNHEIKEQIRENKEATARMADNVKFFHKDFRAYARGPFQGYIKAFWG